MNLFEFYEIDSPLSRRNPVIKLAALGIIALVVTPDLKPSTPWADPGVPLVFLGLLVANLSIFGHIPIVAILRRLLPLALLGLPYLLLRILIFDASPTPIADGLSAGLAVLARVLVYATCILAVIMTTDSTDFAASLMQQARLPYTPGHRLMARLRFRALSQSRKDLIRAAQRLRGLEEPTSGLRRAVHYARPMRSAAKRSAERVALASQSKGFVGNEERTHYRQPKVTVFDWSFLMAVLGVTLVMVEVMIFAGMVDGLSL